jgi:hypothetical protein
MTPDDGRLPALIAARLGLTEGQLYTYAIGIVLALTTAVGAVPTALHRIAPRLAPAAAAAPLDEPDAPGSTTGAELPALDEPDGPALESPLADVSPSGSTIGPAAPQSAPRLGDISVFTRISAPGSPTAIALSRDGTLHVGTNNGSRRGGAPTPSSLLSFHPDGTTAGSIAVEGQPADHAEGLTAAAVDPRTGQVVVLDAATERIIAIDTTNGTQRELARLRDLRPCLLVLLNTCEPGIFDHAPTPVGAAFDQRGVLYVADAGQATIWRLAPGDREPQPWHQRLDYATGDGLAGLALDTTGSLLLTVGTSLDLANPGAGGLYRIAVGNDGRAGRRTLVVGLHDARPGALAVGSSGTTYTVLRSTGSVLAVRPDGSTVNTYASSPGADVPLDAPSGLVVGNGRVLVANQSGTNDPNNWAVLAIAVDDSPMPTAAPAS